MRLIDADALIEYLDKYVITTKPIAVFFKDIIDDAPTIDAVPHEEHVKALNDLAVAWKNKTESSDTISRADAIHELLNAFKYNVDDSFIDACNMAIEALSADAVQGCDGCRYNTRIPQEQCLRCKRYWRDSYERKGGEDE